MSGIDRLIIFCTLWASYAFGRWQESYHAGLFILFISIAIVSVYQRNP